MEEDQTTKPENPFSQSYKKQFTIPKEISRVELVNNCTTVTGFEIRIVYWGEIYHGSFNIDSEVYKKLSQFQSVH